MDSDEDYEFDIDTEVPIERSRVIEQEGKRFNSPSSSENGDDYDSPPVLSPIHAMDIPSVRRPPVSGMIPADRVSAHNLPLAETLSVVERGLFHTTTTLPSLSLEDVVSWFQWDLHGWGLDGNLACGLFYHQKSNKHFTWFDLVIRAFIHSFNKSINQ